MDKQFRKMKLWFCGLLIAVSLVATAIITIRKAMEIRKTIQWDITRNAALGEQGLWTQYGSEYYERYNHWRLYFQKGDEWVRNTRDVAIAATYGALANDSYKSYTGPADYPNSVGVGIALVDSHGNEIKLKNTFLVLNEYIDDYKVQTFAVFEDESFLAELHSFTRPDLPEGSDITATCENMLKNRSPITLVGKRNNGLITVTELTIHYTVLYGDVVENDIVEDVVITFPQAADAEGEEVVFSTWEGDVKRGLIPESELHGNSFYHLCGNEEYDYYYYKKNNAALRLCKEAKFLLLEDPLLGLKSDNFPITYEEGNGLFTLKMQYNWTDEVEFDAEKGKEVQGDTFAVLFVAHPFRLAMENLVSIYVIIALILAVALAFFLIRINRLQKMQEKYERSRLAMTRYTAHELKTPLAVARNYAVALAGEQDDPETRTTRANAMIKQIDLVNTLVEDLLELSRLESDAKTPVPENIDLTSLTGALLAQIESLTGSRQVTVDAPEGECLISADLSMIRTVLMNFLTNAARYSQSYISVTIAREKNHIRWSVKNDGTAIPEEDRNRVWDAFYTVDESRSKRKGGTGLGLAITKQILDLHKAKYGCTGNATETEFFFEMPEVVEAAEEETAE